MVESLRIIKKKEERKIRRRKKKWVKPFLCDGIRNLGFNIQGTLTVIYSLVCFRFYIYLRWLNLESWKNVCICIQFVVRKFAKKKSARMRARVFTIKRRAGHIKKLNSFYYPSRTILCCKYCQCHPSAETIK